MSQDKNHYISYDAQQKIDYRLFFKSSKQKHEHFQLRFDVVNERANKVNSGSRKGQPTKAPNVQQRERNSYKHIDKDDYGEELNEEDCTPNVNLSKFG